VSPRSESLPPATLAQFGEHHLDAPGRAALDALHHVGQRRLWRNRQEHVHMIPRQHAAYDMDAKPDAGLTDDLAQTFTHPALQNLEPAFGHPDDVVTMVKSRMRSFGIPHDPLSPEKRRPLKAV